MTAMILAAGRGERLRPITDSTPKALVEIGGVTLLERHLRRIADAGIENVVINLDWLGEQIVERVGDGRRYGVQVSYSPEYGKVLETAGGIRRALPLLGSKPFWAINADVFTDVALPDIGLRESALGHLLLVDTPSFKAKGDFDLHNGRVSYGDRPALTFSGIAYYRPELFQTLEPGRRALAPLLFAAADRGALTGSLLDGVWEDVGTPERLENARRRAPGAGKGSEPGL